MVSRATGVLLTAFGGPGSLESVGPFMARFMGREPSAEVVATAKDRYRAIGGASPLPATAAAVASSLQRRLAQTGSDVLVRAGMRYWEPSIERAIEQLADSGAERIIMVSLSAFESKVTCEAYRVAAHDAAGAIGHVDLCEAPALHLAPRYRAFFGGACAQALEGIRADRPLVVMTAHSLPAGDLVEDDPYVGGLREVAEAVASIAGLSPGEEIAGDRRLRGIHAYGSLEGPAAWIQGYQSQGTRPGAWLGPGLDEVMDAAAASGYDAVTVVPIGFAIDHLETLWDLDVAAAERAIALGLDFVRTAVPNDSESLVDALQWAVEPLL